MVPPVVIRVILRTEREDSAPGSTALDRGSGEHRRHALPEGCKIQPHLANDWRPVFGTARHRDDEVSAVVDQELDLPRLRVDDPVFPDPALAADPALRVERQLLAAVAARRGGRQDLDQQGRNTLETPADAFPA